MKVTHDITESVIQALGPGATSAKFSLSDYAFDVSIGGAPFLLQSTDETPYRRQTAPFRKQRFDNAATPGEQSLDGAWIRSQGSWHLGAGIKFLEPTDDAVVQARFNTGSAVDVSEVGEVTITDRPYGQPSDAVTTSGFTTARTSGSSTLVSWYDSGAGAVKTATYTKGSATTVASTAITGVVNTNSMADTGGYLAFVKDGTSIHDVELNVVTTNLPVAGGTRQSGLGYAKGWFFYNSKGGTTYGSRMVLWAISRGTADASTVSNPLGTAYGPAFTNFVDAPSGIYCSAGPKVYRIGLDSSTASPSLTAPVEVAELPADVLEMHVHLGAFLMLRTSEGVRVADLADSGSLTVGPVLFEYASTNTRRTMFSSGRFAFVGVDGWLKDSTGTTVSGLVRIDFGSEVPASSPYMRSSMRFGYAGDWIGAANDQISTTGNENAITVNGIPRILRWDSNYSTSAFITTGQIRFSTFEKKLFRSFTVDADIPTGCQVSVLLVFQNGSESSEITLGETSGVTEEIPIRSILTPVTGVSLKFVLTGNGSATPTLRGFQLRAEPMPNRKEMLQLPLVCTDFVKDRNGVRFGSKGYALSIFKALKEVENSGKALIYQDFKNGENLEVVIDSVDFLDRTPNSAQSGFGGLLTCTVRTL